MMQKQTVITWLLLLIFTVTTGLISNINGRIVAVIILILAALKFMGIAFQFMELKNAHGFWKGLLIGYVVVFIGLVLVIFQ